MDSTPVWLFDLDNTLYPVSTGLMDAISTRISLFIEQQLNLPPALAEEMRRTYYGRYGSSVVGILRHCQVDVDAFLNFVHDLPLERYLAPTPDLERVLASLPGRKYIFTNAPAIYARRVLSTLGIDSHFLAIFDIQFADFAGKPAPAVYEKVLTALDHPAGVCWFVEDSVINLLPAKALGCQTVWITQEIEPRPVYIDYVIRELGELVDLGIQYKSTGIDRKE